MELGQYGWGKKARVFQQNIVFLESPAPATSNYGVLNIGDAPFDGTSSGCFNAFGATTGIAINVRNLSSYSHLRFQVNGANVFIVDGDGASYVLNNPRPNTLTGLLNLGSQFFSGAGQFAGSANGTYLAINSTSGFAGHFLNLQKAGTIYLVFDASGNLNITTGFFQNSHDPYGDATSGLINLGSQFFTGAGQFSGSSNGTGIAVNTASGFTGNLADWQVNGVSKLKVDATGNVTATTVTATKLRGTEALDVAARFL
jgi:hypothetical protein